MSATIEILTAEDLERLPDDGARRELVRGELRRMVPPGFDHGHLALRIATRLCMHVEAHQLGRACTDAGFLLARDPDTVRAPDAAFVSRSRLEGADETKGYWPGAPDLAIEVVSPGDRYTEVEDKVQDWLDAGTRMVIVVNPRRRTVTVHRSRTDATLLTVADTLDGGDVVPGWRLPLADIFVPIQA